MGILWPFKLLLRQLVSKYFACYQKIAVPHQTIFKKQPDFFFGDRKDVAKTLFSLFRSTQFSE